MLLTQKEYELEILYLKKMGLTDEEIEGYFELYGLEIIVNGIIWN